MKRTYTYRNVKKIAGLAHVSKDEAREHLDELESEGFAQTDGEGRYRRSDRSILSEQAVHILGQVDRETLVERIEEMSHELQAKRNEWGVESPEEAIGKGIDSVSLQQWQTTQRNLGFAKFALVLNDAMNDE